MASPAEIIIDRFGGHQKVAKALKISVSSVYKWTYTKDRGGTNGNVPTKHQRALLDAGQKLAEPISPADFFAPQPKRKRAA